MITKRLSDMLNKTTKEIKCLLMFWLQNFDPTLQYFKLYSFNASYIYGPLVSTFTLSFRESPLHVALVMTGPTLGVPPK